MTRPSIQRSGGPGFFCYLCAVACGLLLWLTLIERQWTPLMESRLLGELEDLRNQLAHDKAKLEGDLESMQQSVFQMESYIRYMDRVLAELIEERVAGHWHEESTDSMPSPLRHGQYP